MMMMMMMMMMTTTTTTTRTMITTTVSAPSQDVPIRADGSCGDGWVCEHRWPAIAHMVRFRNTVNGTDVRHWSDQSDFVAFSRGDVGFFAMTSANTYQGDVKTSLPPGRYCELISECQQIVTVDDQGSVHLDMDGNVNPIMAVLSGKTCLKYCLVCFYLSFYASNNCEA